MKKLKIALVSCFAAAAVVLAPARVLAQGVEPRRTGVDLELVAGYAGFIDENMLDHGVIGGAVRVWLTPRVATRVELLYMRGPGEDRDWTVVPSLSFDLRREGRLVPYVVGGAGWLRTTTSVGTGLYSSSSWTVGGGAGVRVGLSARSSMSIEGQLGTEPLTRLTVAFGIRLP
jgi:hypothetical protein